MAIQRDGKWIPVVDNYEMEVCIFKNYNMIKVVYETKEEAEEQERKIEEVMSIWE